MQMNKFPIMLHLV